MTDLEQPGLFDGPAHTPLPEPERLTPDRQRTLRHADLLAKGWHPISGRRLHPDAAPADERTAAGARCRGCRFHSTTNGLNGRHWPKCQWKPEGSRGAGPFTSKGPATDCRGWLPACALYQPHNPEGQP